MLRCIEIATKGLGATAPNPMVGCVIVHNEKIIGEGFTGPYGSAHAEVNAITAVPDKSLLQQATLYVTLEPCSHFGKTPPCVDLIIEHKIPKVVVGLSDPFEKVAGSGIEKLRTAGREVRVGILQKECREHHRRFLTFHEQKRPYIILKWAETSDGFIAPRQEERNKNPEPLWITDSYSRQLVHKWRSEEQAILVGTNTVLKDNSKLDVRQWKGKNPLRIVLDRKLKIKGDYHVLDGSLKTLILTEIEDSSHYLDGIEYALINFSKNIAGQINSILHKKNVLSVFVEGGAQTLQTFIDADLWDESRIFIGNSSFGIGTKAPTLTGSFSTSQKIGQDTLKIVCND